MKKKEIFLLTGVLLVFSVIVVGIWNMRKNTEDNKGDEANFSTPSESEEQAFASDGLATDTSITSIPMDLILDGGPGKDGIPALTDPEFVSSEKARAFLDGEDEGIVVSSGGVSKFYPFSILVWHEIVNDFVGTKPFVITFCPLCGSSIVFETPVGEDGERDIFGVSGKLYESNLLMYDQKTESLWSQILGEAVVGERTGEELEVASSKRLTFNQALESFPEVQVLSEETGFRRNYGSSPYGNYEENEQLYFPVQVDDERFNAKALMYIVNFNETSVAFHYDNLREVGEAQLKVGEEVIRAEFSDGAVEVTDPNGEQIPGYFAMWFSWATHHQDDGVVWSK